MTVGEEMQSGCLMKILEAERWLQGANLCEVAPLQQQQEQGGAGAPHPGAREVEGRDALGKCEGMATTQEVDPFLKGDTPHLRPQPSRTKFSPTHSKVLPLRHGGWVPRVLQAGPGQKEPNCRARSA